MKPISQQQLIFLVSIAFGVFYNYPLFYNILKVYPFEGLNIIYILSLSIVLIAFIHLFFTLLSSKYTTKALLIITLLVSSFTTYFMNTYNVVIDDSMIRNALQTNVAESLDLVSFKMILYLLFLGVIPAFFVYKTPLEYRSFKYEIIAKIKGIGIALGVIAIIIFSFSKFYTSFFREHKVLRFYSNPTYWIYSIGWYIQDTYKNKDHTLKQIGLDAKIDPHQKRRIVFMVVGEAARADHFSLNGYTKPTNPKLSTQDLFNFEKAYSCGTSTAHSVPCMFSIYTKKEYSYQKALYTENVLDVLKHTNQVAILWRDNNSNSKGVALRVAYEDFKTPSNNPVCDEECRDIGMLHNLDHFIQQHKDKDILIILHQMGNHGPAYYKRYPKEKTIFQPVCKTNQLEQCSKESISNAYDNALAYTDTFLNATIEFAKKYKNADTAVVYMSDHGESLGENGIYLHGLPYFIAPDAQIHIGAFIWLNQNFKNAVDISKLKAKRHQKISQDYLFHTLLGLFDVKTKVYDPKLDLLK